jgi:hypothetical protein
MNRRQFIAGLLATAAIPAALPRKTYSLIMPPAYPGATMAIRNASDFPLIIEGTHDGAAWLRDLLGPPYLYPGEIGEYVGVTFRCLDGELVADWITVEEYYRRD